jgi:hypothetical protein
MDAVLLPLQGQQGSLERSVGLDQTVATMVMDYDPNPGTEHISAIA